MDGNAKRPLIAFLFILCLRQTRDPILYIGILLVTDKFVYKRFIAAVAHRYASATGNIDMDHSLSLSVALFRPVPS